MTTAVGPLTPAEVRRALDRGAAVAEDYRRRGLIAAAALFLAGGSESVGDIRPTTGGDTSSPARKVQSESRAHA